MYKMSCFLKILLPVVVLTASSHLFATSVPIRTIEEAQRLPHSDYVNCRHFELKGQITAITPDQSFILSDGDARVCLYQNIKQPLRGKFKIGDIVIAKGIARFHDEIYEWLRVFECTVIGHHPIPPAVNTTLSHIRDGSHNLLNVIVTGTITSAFPDEIDDVWYYLTIQDSLSSICLTLKKDEMNDLDFTRLVGARVQIAGLASNWFGLRRFINYGIHVASIKDIRILTPAPDPFSVPNLDNPIILTADEVFHLGRRKVSGRVLAHWTERRILLSTDDGRIVRVDLSLGCPKPHTGDIVRAAGTVTTDLFRLSLTDAIVEPVFSKTPSDQPNAQPPLQEARFLEEVNLPRNMVILFGKPVQVNGTIRRLHSRGDIFSMIELESNGRHFSIETGDPEILGKDLCVGCRISATGLFVTESDSWHPSAVLPRITGMAIVPRTKDDIRILARPPWWTPARLACAMAVMLVALIGFFLWNRWLNRLVNRRSRELFKEQIASANAELRIDERTRLAAELHDSLSQNLSGIACQLNAAKLTLEGNPETRDLLQTTERMLQSCRTELTRCIWDLRGDTLEEPDFTAAIRKTLAALALPAEIQVRFNVPRAKVSDSTAHAILCIVRELVTNAVRHGHATCVKVAGSVKRDSLLFSVRDDGCGFDTADRPGVGEGHFGLAGIGDRISRLGGTFDLESHPGAGTSARIAIPLVHGSDSRKSAL